MIKEQKDPGLQIRIILGCWIRIRIRVKSWIRIRIKVNIQKFEGSKWSRTGMWMHTMGAWSLEGL
jgi:hypothetical protein